MQSLDPHTLFYIFEQGDEQVYEEHGLEDTLNNPYVLMGMVLQGLENFTLMDIMYTRHYGENYKRVKSAIKYKYYNKLYGYLERIDSKNFDSIHKIGESFDRQAVNIALGTLIVHFEFLEEYEKCAVIKRYMDHLEKKDEKKVVTLI